MKKKDWENDIIEKYNNIKTPIYIYMEQEYTGRNCMNY